MRTLLAPSLVTLLLAGAGRTADLPISTDSAMHQPRPNQTLNGDADQRPANDSPRDNRTLCDNAVVLSCNEVFNGSSALSQNGDTWSNYCFSGDTGPEVIHVLEHGGGPLTLTLNSGDSSQLDLILLGGCDEADCLAMPWLVGSSESISGSYPAGTYHVVVDAYGWDGQPFTYTLETSCLGNVDLCANAIPLLCGSTVVGSSDDSQNGNAWSSYCFSGDSGPEVIYSLEHPGGPLNLQLSSTDSEQLDLILLGSCDSQDCLAMPWLVGSDETISGDYPAGTYHVVVDAYGWNGQPFTFELSAICPGEADYCASAIPLGCDELAFGNSEQSQNGNLWGEYCFSGESAPEVIYVLNHPGGLLDLSLSSEDSNQLDLILLGSCDPADCLAMPWLIGSSESISGVYPAGEYYVVVDAFNWNGLPFSFALRSGPCIDGLECHHGSSSLLLSLPDINGIALEYYQLFVPATAGVLGQVTLNLNTSAFPDHAGVLSLSVLHADGLGQPTLLQGQLDVDTDLLLDGYNDFDMSGLGYAVTPGQDFSIGLSFTGDGPADRIGFYAGEPGGYDGFSSFYDGVSYDSWWANGGELYDELNLCMLVFTAPCPPRPMSVEPSGSDIVLSWTPDSGQIRIEASLDAYAGFLPLATVDASLGSWTDANALGAPHRFYRIVHICN